MKPYETIPAMTYPGTEGEATYDPEHKHWVVKEIDRIVGYIYRDSVAGKHVFQLVTSDVSVDTVAMALEILRDVQHRHDR